MSAAYEIAPLVLIRMAGIAFEPIAQLATPHSVELAREIVRAGGVGRELRQKSSGLTNALELELNAARQNLYRAAGELLPPHLVFSSGEAADLVPPANPDGEIERRNNRSRGREQHLLLYLQRVATKNDTFSRFGPTGWGVVSPDATPLALDPQPGIAAREAFFERWVTQAVIDAINRDDAAARLTMPAMQPYTFEWLVAQIEHWPASDLREKWLPLVHELAEAPRRFATTESVAERRALIAQSRSGIHELGGERETGGRFLYSATNPIAEECYRECHFKIGQPLLDEITGDAAPWIDLWRDTYAFVASRVAGGLRRILEQAGAKTGVMPLPHFLAACQEARLPLQTQGLVAFAVMAFQEVKGAMAERLRPHADAIEYELTAEDCAVVRQRFEFPAFDEYTYPSADLQLAAASVEAVNQGNYRWLLAELHPPPAILHHCMYWACPDKPGLHAALVRAAAGKPNFHFGFFAADFTAHTTVHLFDALPGLTSFVASGGAKPDWQRVPPEATEVFVDQQTGDVGLRRIGTREYLGSFARAWLIPLGFHPFQFTFAPHTPRLRCGKVVVQRRAWTVTLEEFAPGNYHGISRELLFAVERLRATRDLPRHVYIRPTEQALRRSGAQGRDKDTKPIYIDLESYLFQEIFYRWLAKAGEIEVTEMLPAPDELLWQEADGRRTFELRTLVVPRP